MVSRREVLGASVAAVSVGCMEHGDNDSIPCDGGEPAKTPQYRKNGRRNIFLNENISINGNKDIRGLGEGVIPQSPPAASNEVLAVPGQDGLYLLSLNGEKRWRFSPKNEKFKTTPAISCQHVFAPGRKKLYAVDVKNGEEKWSVSINGSISSRHPLLCSGSRLFVPKAGGGIVTIDAGSGDTLWKWGTESHFTTGLAAGGPLFAAVDRVSTREGTAGLFHIDPETGKTIWHYGTGGPVDQAPVVSDDHVAITDNRTGSVHIIRTETGRLRHRLGRTATEPASATPPTLTDESVVFTEPSPDGSTTAEYGLDGERVWQAETGSVDHSPVVTPDSVVVINRKGRLYQLARKDGAQTSVISGFPSVRSHPVVSGGKLIIEAPGTRVSPFVYYATDN